MHAGWILATGLLVTACGPHWVGDGLHQIDGIPILTERDCHAHCPTERLAAAKALGVDGDQVTRAFVATPPTDYEDWRGNRTIGAFGGLIQPIVVVLELRDGTRRAVELACGQVGTDPPYCVPFQPPGPGP